MSFISIVETGLIYRNPAAHLRSLHAYYPSVVSLSGGQLLASFVIGSAMEAMDSQLYTAHSQDNGKTWSPPKPLHEKSPKHTETGRIAHTSDGEVVLLLSESLRTDPNIGATNPANLGHVPTDLSLFRSRDRGETWKGPQTLAPPIVGPTFELCSPIVMLNDDLWLLPTSTWRGWEGDAPNGMKAVAFVSQDQGQSWQRCIDVMNGVEQGVLYWEQKIVAIDRGRILSVAWAYEESRRQDKMNHYAIADHKTLEFDDPIATPLKGQTPELLHLGDGIVLCVYRRTDEPGLWACVLKIETDGRWTNLEQCCLWRPVLPPPKTDGGVLVEQFRGLKFGAPTLVRLSDTEIYLAFWCVEDAVANIRWVRLSYGHDA